MPRARRPRSYPAIRAIPSGLRAGANRSAARLRCVPRRGRRPSELSNAATPPAARPAAQRQAGSPVAGRRAGARRLFDASDRQAQPRHFRKSFLTVSHALHKSQAGLAAFLEKFRARKATAPLLARRRWPFKHVVDAAAAAPLTSLRLVDIPEHRGGRAFEHAGQRFSPGGGREILAKRDIDNLVVVFLLDVCGDLLLLLGRRRA